MSGESGKGSREGSKEGSRESSLPSSLFSSLLSRPQPERGASLPLEEGPSRQAGGEEIYTGYASSSTTFLPPPNLLGGPIPSLRPATFDTDPFHESHFSDSSSSHRTARRRPDDIPPARPIPSRLEYGTPGGYPHPPDRRHATVDSDWVRNTVGRQDQQYYTFYPSSSIPHGPARNDPDVRFRSTRVPDQPPVHILPPILPPFHDADRVLRNPHRDSSPRRNLPPIRRGYSDGGYHTDRPNDTIRAGPSRRDDPSALWSHVTEFGEPRRSSRSDSGHLIREEPRTVESDNESFPTLYPTSVSPSGSQPNLQFSPDYNPLPSPHGQTTPESISPQEAPAGPSSWIVPTTQGAARQGHPSAGPSTFRGVECGSTSNELSQPNTLGLADERGDSSLFVFGKKTKEDREEPVVMNPGQKRDEEEMQRRPYGKTPMACLFCKGRKLRCDGGRPCKNCIKRRHNCAYPDRQKRRGPGKAPKGTRKGAGKLRGVDVSAKSPPNLPGVREVTFEGTYETRAGLAEQYFPPLGTSNFDPFIHYGPPTVQAPPIRQRANTPEEPAPPKRARRETPPGPAPPEKAPVAEKSYSDEKADTGSSHDNDDDDNGHDDDKEPPPPY